MNYKKIYDLIINRAKDRILNSYKEKHHIIPRCLGGTNEKSNIVQLTAKEHFICHLLLCEIYPKEKSLKSARWAMTILKSKNHDRKYKISSSQYDRIKNEMSIIKKGVERSYDTKEKISKKMFGRKLSEETKEKIANAMTGKIQSEEHKKNQSLSKKGQIPWNKNKKLCTEHKQKISKTMRSKKINK